MRELFVWYRVGVAQAAVAEAAVRSMQQALTAEHGGLVAGLLVRRHEPAGVQTWMETYACPGKPGGIDADVERSIEARARSLAGTVDGTRHVEAFERLRG